MNPVKIGAVSVKKRLMLVLLTLLLLFGSTYPVYGAAFSGEVNAVSVLLMEAVTGTVLYEHNADQKLPPASVTKVMTMLLVMEAVDSGKIALSDLVPVSEHAASMGGSQVYLKVGETLTVEEMLKCVVISSANDAAVALAEFVAGSEESFVLLMNQRAAELGMVNTLFENTNGLDDTTDSHLTTARDIALMSRELIVRHPAILTYSSIWMDTIRDGAFGLSNTNRLIRFYAGANGLKTGSTAKAKFCISAAAKRENMQLIAVVMAAPNRDSRNETAKKLLDFGFANYDFAHYEGGAMERIPVTGSVHRDCALRYGDFSAVLEKGSLSKVEKQIDLPAALPAPVRVGDPVGTLTYTEGGKVIGAVPIYAAESCDKVGYFALFGQLLRRFFLH